MFRSFLRRVLPRRQHLDARWYLRPFRALLHDPALWAVHRRGVTRAFALGVFIAFLPITPLQLPLLAGVTIWWRVNLPVAVVAVFLNNPLTLIQLYYLNYRVGTWLLGREPVGFPETFSLQLIVDQLTKIGAPLFLGAVVVGGLAAAIAYAVTNGLWRLALLWRFRRRSRRQRERLQQL